jgi:hypothetical protein
LAIFPSVEWFDEVRAIYNSDDSFQSAGGGALEAEVGIKIGDQIFQISFTGKQCVNTSVISDAALIDLDFYLEMEPENWQLMLENIKSNGHADLAYTLNTLDLERDHGLAKSESGDQYRHDMFFRFNQTFQFFFDASARVDTQFI